jgi:hypothetical protein
MAYLAQLRAEHAAALFLSTDEPVTTIGRGQLQGVVERLDGVCFERFGNPDGPRALAQVWKAQHFSLLDDDHTAHAARCQRLRLQAAVRGNSSW